VARINLITRLAALALLALAPLGAALAQPAWPSRPIRLIVPYPPGGQTDIVSRFLAEKLAPVLGQPVVVDNRAGAQGIVGVVAAKQAPADGYTFVYVNSSNFCINVFAYTKLPYSPLEDFDMVTQLGEAALGMIVSSASGIRTVDEYVAHARRNPGKTTFASFGMGSSSHLYGEMLKNAAKLDSVHVAYKGAGPATQDIVAGVATMGVHDFATTGPFIQAGRATLLAVTGTKRWPVYPNTPTFSEQGYPLDLVGWNGIVTNKGAPRAAVERMSQEINRILHSPEGRKRILELGLLATGTTPAEFTEIVRKDTPRWGEVFKASGVPPQQ
jgi:tripartite-type tricarboxylate transporter receptor subunit TctC